MASERVELTQNDSQKKKHRTIYLTFLLVEIFDHIVQLRYLEIQNNTL